MAAAQACGVTLTKPGEVLWVLGELVLLLQSTCPTKRPLKEKKFYGLPQQTRACSLALGGGKRESDLQQLGDLPPATSPGAACIWWSLGVRSLVCCEQLGVTVYSLKDD